MNKRYKYLTDADYATAKANDIGKATLTTRLRRGWDIERAITEGVQEQVNDIKKWIPLAESNDIKLSTLRGRAELGWDLELAATTPTIIKR